ncbi:very short patch repair endonuclease [Georgenia faecalis]|uniref:very short patch repair endonuclease n=1 Tax=Georgenia faecalis TaxID=2483799 RepID=UPI0030BA2211
MARTFSVPPHPGSSGAAVSARMSTLRRRDTAPEVAVRRLLHAAGRRYRVAYRVPGNARRTIDIAFTRARVAVFIDGCFWHGCTEHGTQPTSNSAWWSSKLGANQARDADTTARLVERGWIVLRFWEHEEPESVVERILAVLQPRSPRA